MGLLKALLLALAAALGVAVDRFNVIPSVVAAALVLILWVVVLHGYRQREEK
jgi:hypothetical protein